MNFQFIAIQCNKRFPIHTLRHNWRPAVRWLRKFVSHLEEEQKGNLLRVSHVRQTVVAQNVRKTPSLINNYLSCVTH